MTTPPRAARWSRVSSARQSGSDREGLPYQRDLQDTAIAALRAQDTGIDYRLSHSGGSVDLTPEWADMIARAGTDFDVLMCAYTSRMSRDAEELLRAVRLIGAAGASVYFAEEEISTANESQWRQFANQVVNAEAYRRELRVTMRRTYESRWRRRGLPAGEPPYGFLSDWSHDPDAAPKVKTLFEEYAQGGTSLRALAEHHGLAEEQVKVIMRNPAYKGVAQHNGEERPASFEPIVDADLWASVAQMRQQRRFAGGPPSNRPSMLQRRLWCACGAPTRLDGRDGQGFDRVRHLKPCHIWGQAERRRTIYYETPIKKAFSQIQLTEDEIERMVAHGPAMQAIPAAPRFTHQREQVASDLVSRRIGGREAENRLDEIDQDEQIYLDDLAHSQQVTLSDDRLREILHQFSAMIASANGKPYEDGLWANVVGRYVSRIEHLGPNSIRLTPSAEGLAALVPATFPERVEVGGEGLEPPTFSV